MPTKSKMFFAKVSDRPISSLICLAAQFLTVPAWLVMTLPSTAATIPTSYRNQYRSCAGRLLDVGISPEAAASACAAALRPTDLSKCVAKIEQQTAIASVDALATCTQVRRPNELANCVVGISRNAEEDAVGSILNYCGRSLLPERFAECVVGLRIEADFTPTDAMTSCIDASDRLGAVSPTFIPENQTPLSQPTSTPIEPENQTPLIQPAPTTPVPELTPSPDTPTPENQTSPQQTPTTTSVNPG